MATTYGVNATKRDVDVPSKKITVAQNHGRMRVAYDSYTFISDTLPAANDVLKMMKLPKGAMVHDVHLICGQLGSGAGKGELDVGYEANGVDVADPDAFIDGAEVGSAAYNASMRDVASHAGIGKTLGAETQVIVTAKETVDSADTEVLKLWVYYTLD